MSDFLTDLLTRVEKLEMWAARRASPSEMPFPGVTRAPAQHVDEPQYPREMTTEREGSIRTELGNSAQVVGKDLPLDLLAELDAERLAHLKTEAKLVAMTRLAKEHRANAIWATDHDTQCVGFGDRLWREAVAERDEAHKEAAAAHAKHKRLKAAALTVVAVLSKPSPLPLDRDISLSALDALLKEK